MSQLWGRFQRSVFLYLCYIIVVAHLYEKYIVCGTVPAEVFITMKANGQLAAITLGNGSECSMRFCSKAACDAHQSKCNAK